MDTNPNIPTLTLNPQEEAAKTERVVTHKVCPTCKHTKPIEDFYKNKASPDGHQAACIPCLKDYQKEYRKTHAATAKAEPKPSPRRAPAKPAAGPITRELVTDPQYAQSIARTAQLLVTKGVPVKAAFEMAVDLAENGLIVRPV